MPADQAVLDALIDLDPAVLQDDAVFDLAVHDLAAVIDAGKGPNEGIDDARMLADDHRPADGAVDDLGPRLDDHLAAELRGAVHVALNPRRHLFQHQAVGVEHVLHLAGVNPPTFMDVGIDLVAVLHQVLDRVGDLELVAPGRPDGLDGLKDVRVKHIDTDQGQVARRIAGLFDQADDTAGLVEHRHPTLLGMLHPRQDDLGIPVALGKLPRQGGNAPPNEDPCDR